MRQEHSNRIPLGEVMDRNSIRTMYGEGKEDMNPKDGSQKLQAELSNTQIISLNKQLSEYRKQLEKAQGKIERKDEMIQRLSRSKVDNAKSSTNDLETRLKELMQRHSVSKNKYLGQLNSLQSQNKTLQDQLTRSHETTASTASELQNLRELNMETLTQLDTMRLELSTIKRRNMGWDREDKSREKERASWNGKKDILHEEIEDLKNSRDRYETRNQALKQSINNLKEESNILKRKNKTLEEELALEQAEKKILVENVQQMTVAYLNLYRNTVPKDVHQVLERNYSESRLQVDHWRLKTEMNRLDLLLEKEEAKDLRERMDIAEEEIKSCKNIIENLCKDREMLRSEMGQLLSPTVLDVVLEYANELFVPLSQSAPFIKLCLNHITLSDSYHGYQMETLATSNASLTTKLSSTSSILSACQSSLAELKREHHHLECQQIELKKAHEPCDEIKQNLAEMEMECMFRGQKIQGLQEDIGKLEIKAKKDAECVKTANESMMRSKMAEEALDEEVKHLRNAYIEASAYQDLYNDLKDQQSLLLARESAAIEEAERLAGQNAELAGHTNEMQKISYIETVRKEMFHVKQELATTRHLLNNANDKIQFLNSEIAAYQSVNIIGESQGSRGCTRAGIVGRQPEGGRLTVYRVRRSSSDYQMWHSALPKLPMNLYAAILGGLEAQMTPDIFLGEPAKPTTSLAGTYLFSTPVNASVYIKRYRISLSHTVIKNGGHAAKIAADDRLEAFWKRLADKEGMTKEWMEDWVGVIVNGESGREIWCFSTSCSELQVQDGLEEIIPPLPPIVLQQCMACPVHASSTSCLSPDLGCVPTFIITGEPGKAWKLLKYALVEKIAWRHGFRILLAGPRFLKSPAINVSLCPFNHSALLLTVRNTPCSTSSSTHTLLPLLIPSYHLSTYSFTSQQSDQLTTSFDALLGHFWRKGKEEYIVQESLRGHDEGEWGIYWIHLFSAQEGVLVVWPKHLAIANSPPSSANTIPSANRFPSSSITELMGTAQSLFDFFTTYQPPSPPVADVEMLDADNIIDDKVGKDSDQVNVAVVADNVATESVLLPGLAKVVNGQSSPPEQPPSAQYEGSDIDDLFSDSSPTPQEMQKLSQQEDLSNAKSIFMPFANPVVETRDKRNIDDKNEGEVKDTLITEDDFAFFDSSRTDPEMGLSLQKTLKTDIDVMMSEKVEDVATIQENNTDDMNADSPSQDLGAAEIRDENVDAKGSIQIVEQSSMLRLVAEISKDPDDLAQSPSASLSLLEPQCKPNHRKHLPSLPSHPLIPINFSPLPLLPSVHFMHPYPYSPLSPIPTPSFSLIDRLRPKSIQPLNIDVWNFSDNSDESEMAYTEPPTPISELSERNSIDDKRDETESTISEEEEDLHWGGFKCIGAELLILNEEVEHLKVNWDSSWGTFPSSDSDKSKKDTQEDKCYKVTDWARLAQEVILNRSFRSALLVSETGCGHKFENEIAKILLDGGTRLNELAPDIMTKKFSQPLINTSTCFAHNIIRLSISSLPYWNELGLEPQGGQKDIKVMIVCEQEEDGKETLNAIKRSWKVNKMGNFEYAEPENEGVIVVFGPALLDTACKLAQESGSAHNVVIYLLVRDFSDFLLPSLPSATTLIPLPLPTLSTSLDYEAIAFETYDRVLTPLHPIFTRGQAISISERDRWIPSPSWTLARREPAKPEFAMTYPIDDYDVLNRWRLFHLAYDFIEAKAIVWVGDGRGEAWEVCVLEGKDWQNIIRAIWKFGNETIRNWAGRFRLGVCKASLMEKGEFEAWQDLCKSQADPPTLVMSDSPLTKSCSMPIPQPVANIDPSILVDPNARLVNPSLTGHLTPLPYCLPVEILSSAEDNKETIYPQKSFFLTTLNRGQTCHLTTQYHILYHTLVAGKKDEDTVHEFGEEYYRLGCLVRERWGGEQWLDLIKWGKRALIT
ncbi:uncharacterized protein L203_105258 [Cryptococcus depauperatus CBS 7841]|uniref:Mediator of RNA polymerase II transcription subunit 13 n=1 Tax=Cryptococcus depauperatus CBS 7841 TaxID=1295531 RepID=A0AAJ8JX54_9TREE